jgi:UDP-GlcNAc:undecaprenyl-phosphate GlcNAc-1-phosphate transferase
MYALESHHAVLLVSLVACIASGVCAFLSVYSKNDVTAITGTTLVLLVLVFTRLFGHVECQLLLSKLAVPLTFFSTKGSASRGGATRKVAVRLQGERQWNVLWESLTESAEKLQLLRIDLDINLPAMKEGFHANWHQYSSRERHECWRMEVPLFAEGMAVGRLLVSGDRREQEGSVCDAVDRLIELLGPFEKAFMEVAMSPVGDMNSNHNSPKVVYGYGNRDVETRAIKSLAPTPRAKVVSASS